MTLLGEGANAEIAQSIMDDETAFAHQGVAGTKWGVRKWQNRDGSYTPAGLADKPGGRYNQHSGEGTPWGEGKEDYSGHSKRVGYDYSDEDQYNAPYTNAQVDALKRSAAKAGKTMALTGLAVGTVVGAKLGYDALDKVSGGHAKETLLKDAPEIGKAVITNPVGVFRVVTQTGFPKLGDKINDLRGDVEKAAKYDADFEPSDVTNPVNLYQGKPQEAGTHVWRMTDFDPGSDESQRRKQYVVFDEASADFYAAFGNGLAKAADGSKIFSWQGTAQRKLYIADYHTVIQDVIKSYTNPNSRVGQIDRLAFDTTGQVTGFTRWVCRYLLGGQEDVQKRWVGNHAQVIDFYARAGYDGMGDLTDYFGGMGGSPIIMFGATVKNGEQGYATFEKTSKKISPDVWGGTMTMTKQIFNQKIYVNKLHTANYILRMTNSKKTTIDTDEARKVKPVGDLATAPYDLQEASRSLALKFPTLSDAAAAFVKKKGDSLIDTGEQNILKFKTNVTPSKDTATRTKNSETIEKRLDRAMRSILNSKYSGKTKANYDGEKFLLRQIGAMSYYKLADGSVVKDTIYDSLRQQAVDYLAEHPNSELDIHELMGIIHSWG